METKRYFAQGPEKMNILFLSRRSWPDIGGVETHIGKISEILSKKHKVTNISEKTMDLKRVGEKKKKWYIWKWLFKNINLFQEADIIHIHDVFFWFLPFRLLFPFKKVFITFHGWEGRFPPSLSSKLQRKVAEKLTLGNICIGDYISKRYTTNPTIISYGATDQKKLPLPKENKLLVYGRISKDNDINLVIKALENIKTPVAFLGDGPLKKQAQKVGKVTGFVTNTEKYLKKSSIVITSSYLSILDSLAAGREVISIYSNPLKEDYLKLSPMAKYIHIVDSSNKLTSLLRTPLKKKNTSGSWIKKQTWHNVASLYEKLWKKKN